jgi:hypothetical protein
MALAGRRFGCRRGVSGAAPLFVVAPHTLCLAAKSSRKRAISWLIRPPKDHLRIRTKGVTKSNATTGSCTAKRALVFGHATTLLCAYEAGPSETA